MAGPHGNLGYLRTPRMVAAALAMIAFGLSAAMVCGCQEYRIEHRKRPAFYRQAGAGDLPDRQVLDDGTIVIYETSRPGSGFEQHGKADPEGKPFMIREELETGEIVLRAFLPEHVLVNTLTCIRNEEYELLWDQMLAEVTKKAYEDRGEGPEQFAAFFSKHRQELARTLNRMLLGMPREEVEVVWASINDVGCRLRRHISEQFVFTQVEMVREDQELKLRIIQ